MSYTKGKDQLRVPDEEIGDLYLVSPLMDTDLHRILKTNQQLTDEHAQYFLYQVLKALKFIQGANIVHRDIKPSNILVNADCDTKICDFGLSRCITDPLDDLTEYVVTRFYRAPEIMLSSHEYTNAIDLWSVGCTFGEILSRKVLFPGTNYLKQIDLIVRTLGTPTDEDMDFIANPHAKKFLKSLEPKARIPLGEFLGGSQNPQALDLLGRMLEFSPRKRISVTEALHHPYLADLHDSDEETECKEELDFRFEHEEHSFAEMKQMLLEEVARCSDN